MAQYRIVERFGRNCRKIPQKGSQVYIEGKLRSRSWEDKDGNTRYITEVVGDSMTMLGGGARTNETSSSSSSDMSSSKKENKNPDLSEEKMTIYLFKMKQSVP